MYRSRFTFLRNLGIGLLTSACATWALSQAYPQRPIRAIVPYAAGGFSDQVSRIIAEAIAHSLSSCFFSILFHFKNLVETANLKHIANR